MLDDRNIHEIFLSNKEKGLKILHEKYAGSFYWLGLRYLRNEQDAEEVVIDTFLKVYEHLGQFTFSSEKGLYPWLKKIAVNECLSKIRKRKLNLEVVEVLPEISKAAEVLDQLSYEEVTQALAKLPTLQSVVFQLYEVEGYNHAEIAEKLHLSQGTSKAYLHHARNKLQMMVKTGEISIQ